MGRFFGGGFLILAREHTLPPWVAFSPPGAGIWVGQSFQKFKEGGPRKNGPGPAVSPGLDQRGPVFWVCARGVRRGGQTLFGPGGEGFWFRGFRRAPPPGAEQNGPCSLCKGVTGDERCAVFPRACRVARRLLSGVRGNALVPLSSLHLSPECGRETVLTCVAVRTQWFRTANYRHDCVERIRGALRDGTRDRPRSRAPGGNRRT